MFNDVHIDAFVYPPAANIFVLSRDGYTYIHMETLPHSWPFAMGIHKSTMGPLHKGPVIWIFMLSLFSGWISSWTNSPDPDDLRCYVSMWFHCNGPIRSCRSARDIIDIESHAPERPIESIHWIRSRLQWLPWLTHWGRENNGRHISRWFLDAFSWIEMYEFRIRSH